MTYHCGIGPGMGVLARDPHVTCDASGCDRKAMGQRDDGRPHAWILNGTAPRGWVLRRIVNAEGDLVQRTDLCPRHKGLL